VVSAERATVISLCQQTFDELGMRVHKQNLSTMIHWPGGFGRATKAVVLITGAATYHYAFEFRSMGEQGRTSLHINIQVPYGRFFHAREKAEAKINSFLETLHKVALEYGVSFSPE
jgi:hypothetical protein